MIELKKSKRCNWCSGLTHLCTCEAERTANALRAYREVGFNCLTPEEQRLVAGVLS